MSRGHAIIGKRWTMRRNEWATNGSDSPPRRAFSPRREDDRSYRPRSRTPPRRDERADPYTSDNWRRRSPSPGRAAGHDSVATSRRSSPPVHPSRQSQLPDERPSRPSPADTYAPRDRSPYERDVEPRRRDSPPPARDRDYTNGAAAPPSGPRNGDFTRAPPTGPAARSFPTPAASPPVGPSMSAHNRNPVMSAPSRPRGGGFGRGDYPPSRRGSSSFGRGGYSGGGPPPGPRGMTGGPPPTGPGGSFSAPYRGSANSTSTTYPRTQRFANPHPSHTNSLVSHGSGQQQSSAQQHLADLAQPVPGGRKEPDLYDNSKLLKLEEEMRRLQDQIEEKQAAKRKGLRDWERQERELENAGLKVELAEQHLAVLNGDDGGSGAAF